MDKEFETLEREQAEAWEAYYAAKVNADKLYDLWAAARAKTERARNEPSKWIPFQEKKE